MNSKPSASSDKTTLKLASKDIDMVEAGLPEETEPSQSKEVLEESVQPPRKRARKQTARGLAYSKSLDEDMEEAAPVKGKGPARKASTGKRPPAAKRRPAAKKTPAAKKAPAGKKAPACKKKEKTYPHTPDELLAEHDNPSLWPYWPWVQRKLSSPANIY